jgi:ADP-heptose:LPS heptosyltransferase
MSLLVIEPSSLGDIIHALLIVSELKSRRPEILVDWVVRTEFVEVVEASGLWIIS